MPVTNLHHILQQNVYQMIIFVKVYIKINYTWEGVSISISFFGDRVHITGFFGACWRAGADREDYLKHLFVANNLH